MEIIEAALKDIKIGDESMHQTTETVENQWGIVKAKKLPVLISAYFSVQKLFANM